MKALPVIFRPIGVIRSQHTVAENTPIQPVYASGCRGQVEILSVEVEGIDVLDGTPLLDIKPYTARFDRVDNTRDGWHESFDEDEAQTRGRRNFIANESTTKGEDNMPRGNGTGPRGCGAGTGRGCGPCGAGKRQGPAVRAATESSPPVVQKRGHGHGRGQGTGRGAGYGRRGNS